MKLRALVLLAPLIVLSACGETAEKSSRPAATVTVTASPTAPATVTSTPTPTPTASPTTVDCEAVLSTRQARKLAGTRVTSPRASYIGEVQGCRWLSRDGKTMLGAASLPAGKWVRNIPALLDTARSVFKESPEGIKGLRTLERMLKDKKYRTDRQGCELFRVYVHTLNPSFEEGSDLVIYYLPDTGKTTIVAGQSCVNGYFRSLVVGNENGFKDRDEVADRIEDGLVSAFLS